jgi:hypothetical protein
MYFVLTRRRLLVEFRRTAVQSQREVCIAWTMGHPFQSQRRSGHAEVEELTPPRSSYPHDHLCSVVNHKPAFDLLPTPGAKEDVRKGLIPRRFAFNAAKSKRDWIRLDRRRRLAKGATLIPSPLLRRFVWRSWLSRNVY